MFPEVRRLANGFQNEGADGVSPRASLATTQRSPHLSKASLVSSATSSRGKRTTPPSCSRSRPAPSPASSLLFILRRPLTPSPDLHRNLFRSDVLVTFHPPIKVTATSHPGLVGTPTSAADYDAVRRLTSTLGEQIRIGTLDAPSWSYIRIAHTARRLYAPFGTKLGLGDHVRLTQRFVDVFAKKLTAQKAWEEGTDPKAALKTPMKAREGADYFGSVEDAYAGTPLKPTSAAELEKLATDLKVRSDSDAAFARDLTRPVLCRRTRCDFRSLRFETGN